MLRNPKNMLHQSFEWWRGTIMYLSRILDIFKVMCKVIKYAKYGRKLLVQVYLEFILSQYWSKLLPNEWKMESARRRMRLGGVATLVADLRKRLSSYGWIGNTSDSLVYSIAYECTVPRFKPVSFCLAHLGQKRWLKESLSSSVMKSPLFLSSYAAEVWPRSDIATAAACCPWQLRDRPPSEDGTFLCVRRPTK